MYTRITGVVNCTVQQTTPATNTRLHTKVDVQQLYIDAEPLENKFKTTLLELKRKTK